MFWRSKIYFRAMTKEEIEKYIEHFVKNHLHSGCPISDEKLERAKNWYRESYLIQDYEHLMILDGKKQHIGYVSYTIDGKFEMMNLEIDGIIDNYSIYGKQYVRERFIDFVINQMAKEKKRHKEPDVFWN